MWKRMRSVAAESGATESLLAFVMEIARRQRIEMTGARGRHVVASAMQMCRGATSGEVEVGIVLLEQFRADLVARGR